MGLCYSVLPNNMYHHLKQTVFGQLLTPQQLQQFATYFQHQHISAGTKLYKQSTDNKHTLYIIASKDGVLNITAKQPMHYTIVKQQYDIIHIDKLDHKYYSNTCTAKTNIHILSITHTAIQQYIKTLNDTNIIQQLIILCYGCSQQLSTVSICQGMSIEHIALFAQTCKLHYIKSGVSVFHEGSTGTSMYIVITGELNALTNEPSISSTNNSRHVTPTCSTNSKRPNMKYIESTRQYILTTFTQNEIFGEISLIMDIPRTATITAVHNSIVYEFTRDAYNILQQQLSVSQGVNTQIGLKKMVKARIAEHFRKYNIPFFESLSDADYAQLAQLCQINTYEPHSVIFRQGDYGDQFYLIVHGSVKVSVSKKCSKHIQIQDCIAAGTPHARPSLLNGLQHSSERYSEIELCQLSTGNYFGEIALHQDLPRTATVTTLTQCVILSVTKKTFELVFHDIPEVIADFEIKLARYDIQLKTVLYHPLGLQYFTEYLFTEYSNENIEFWKLCRSFRYLRCSVNDTVVSASHSTMDKYDTQLLHSDTTTVDTKLQQMLHSAAQRIYDTYVSPQSMTQVNLKSSTVKAIELCLAEPQRITHLLFSAAEDEITKLMSTDSFIRFKQSYLFQQFLEHSNSYKHVTGQSNETVKKNRRQAATRKDSLVMINNTYLHVGSNINPFAHGKSKSVDLNDIHMTELQLRERASSAGTTLPNIDELSSLMSQDTQKNVFLSVSQPSVVTCNEPATPKPVAENEMLSTEVLAATTA